MKVAIRIALKNIELGGGPFGAVIVRDGRIISKSGNQVTLNNDPTAHAEVMAIRKAAKKLKTWDLSDCEIYCTCEPCPMCLAAIYWAHIPIIYYGARKEDAKETGFDDLTIYNEMKLPYHMRKIDMKNIDREEALVCFEQWRNLAEKKIY